MRRILVYLVLLTAPSLGFAQSASVHYLANTGVMVTYNDQKIIFDGLFDNSFGTYHMVPDAMRSAMMAGTPPYDDVDAYFISHRHGDHFAAVDVLSLLRVRENVHVYATAQAVAMMREVATPEDEELFRKVTGLDLELNDGPMHIAAGDIAIDVVRVPHGGYPERHADVENLVFRVTLEKEGTVMHLGDAIAAAEYYDNENGFWSEPETDLALPPYWFLRSAEGRAIMYDVIKARNVIGVHVPISIAEADELPPELEGQKIFTRPGEGIIVEDR